MSLQSHKDLDAWRFSMDLAVEVYRWSSGFSREHRYELTSQMRRSAISIPCNIAEGYGRRNRGEYLQFLGIARGSLRELETTVLLAIRVGISEEHADLMELMDKVGKVLYGLERSLDSKE